MVPVAAEIRQSRAKDRVTAKINRKAGRSLNEGGVDADGREEKEVRKWPCVRPI